MSIAGEIFISVDAACKNAPLYNMTVQRELVLYLIHGILHLLGYDDHGPKQIKRMRQREEQILRAIVPKKK